MAPNRNTAKENTVTNPTRLIITILLPLALSACGSTRHFVADPKLTIDGPDQTAHQAATELFDGSTPHTVNLCEADPVSRQCKNGSDSIRANGVAGLFFPLTLNLTGITVSQQHQSDTALSIDATVRSKVDGIPPLCRTAHGQILLKDNDAVTVHLRSFYCNWVIVGNVLANVDLSIDHIDSHNRTFNGFYKITSYGTGVAAGSGYYRAVIVPADAARMAQQIKPR